MKKLSVVVAGTGQIRDVEIEPGTTAKDILDQLGLRDYLLSKGPNDPFFAAAESVYDKVADGEKIFASTKAEVGKAWEVGRAMKVRILSTKEAPSLLSRVIGQVLGGPARAVTIRRNQIPYWQERGWRQEGKAYRGTYKTAYGSFIGRIEEVRPGNFRLYIFDPPRELSKHAHWTCFQAKGDKSYRVHMSRMPEDVSSGILAIERLLTEAFEGR